MGEEQIPVAVIGLGAAGVRAVEAVRGCGLSRLVAVADRDAMVAERVGRNAGCPFFSDTRQVLLSAKPAAVFVAVPPMASLELLAACCERGIHVWKDAPLARNLSEGARLVRMFAKARCKLAVGTQRRFAPAYRRARELRARLGEVFLGRANYLFNWGPALGWRGDRVSAGGGVLLEIGYHCADLLTWMLGLPEQVYGSTIVLPNLATGPEASALPPHDTDDTACALLRYADDAVTTLTASRLTGPVCEELILRGPGGSLTVGADACTLRNPDGNVLDHLADPSPPQSTFQWQAEEFLRAVRDDAPRYPASGAENLLNLAVIDAIYLSSRTNQPELPARQLHLNSLTPEFCTQFALAD